MKRREFLSLASMCLGDYLLSPGVNALEAAPSSRLRESFISFETSDNRYQSVYSHALDTLHSNVTSVVDYPHPVLIEGSNYGGIWLECAPQEALIYSFLRPDVARNNHVAFFAAQRADGQLPCWIRKNAVGYAQIQMVVPIAATAWELAQQTGDSELLEKAYDSCTRWDSWLRRYRDTRGTGLCEAFCTYDTGHDNSPRWVGIPNRCPDGDAKKCPALPSLPRISPDLSATVYGGRIALAQMARALGKPADEDRWHSAADSIRISILNKLYVSEDAAFYDLDARNSFVRVRGDVISRVLGEHVVDQKLFESVYQLQIHNPSAFWAPFPLPSIALNDPAFVRPIPQNSWGGASQALTALRAPRWMEHYGKPADLAYLMQQWVRAILRANVFLQQLDPISGEFTAAEGRYTPSALSFLDFTWRLSGVRRVEDQLEWNVCPLPKSASAKFNLRLTPAKVAELHYRSGSGRLRLSGKDICHTSSHVRLITNESGELKKAIGIAQEATAVMIRLPSGRSHQFSVDPNQIVDLSRVPTNDKATSNTGGPIT